MAIVSLVALFMLSVGFAKIMAICVNWMCALRLPREFVFADKTLNLVLITIYPLVLLYGLGPQIRQGHSWSDIHPAWWPPIALGIVGACLLISSTVRYWRYRPACELSVSSQLVDLRTSPDWQLRLIGTRRRWGRLSALPGNEQFTIEVSTKTYHLPGLPACWEGLSIVHLSDFHFCSRINRAYFEAVCDQAAALQPDLFVFSGDLLDDQDLLTWLPETLGRLKAPLGQFFVLGNHDWYLDPEQTRREFIRLGWTDVASQPVTLTRPDQSTAVPLVLCGDETPWMGSHVDISQFPSNALRILISHTPDNINWARNHGIHLMLAGHTHGGQIRLPILGPIYSPSRFGCQYSAGIFWREPTLMYVSRGISGKEPLRYNCPPEVTKLIAVGPDHAIVRPIQ